MTFAELSFGAYVYGLFTDLTKNPIIDSIQDWQKCPNCLLFLMPGASHDCASARRAWQPVPGNFEWRYPSTIQPRWWSGDMSNDGHIKVLLYGEPVAGKTYYAATTT